MQNCQYLVVTILLLLAEGTVNADLVLTYNRNFNLNGNNFQGRDLARTDGTSSSLFFDNAAISGDSRITGFHHLSGGEFLFTTQGNFQLGIASYDRGDIVRYNRETGASSLVFDSAVLSQTRISAVSQFANGDIAFALKRNTLIGSTSYSRGDVVRYNTITDSHSLFFDIDSITLDARDIEAIHVLSDHELILSHNRDFTLGGIRFRRGDLVRYNTLLDLASLYRAREDLGSTRHVTAISVVPEPQYIFLIFALLCLLQWFGRLDRHELHLLGGNMKISQK